MKSINGNLQLALNASEKVYISDVEVSGTKGTGNGKVLLDCSELVIKDSVIAEGSTVYNVFEQKQTVKFPMASMKVDGVNGMANTIKHNVFNVYNFADGATVSVENCEFDLNVAASNVMRISNYKNAENVTIHFKNVKWNYENVPATDEDWAWAGMLLFQPAGKDAAFTGDLSALKTWEFIFEDCYYNGTKVTENGFGTHAQAMYLYNLNNDGSIADPADYDLKLTFK